MRHALSDEDRRIIELMREVFTRVGVDPMPEGLTRQLPEPRPTDDPAFHQLMVNAFRF